MRDDDEPPRAYIDIYIRSRQHQYLEYLAERDGCAFSRAFEKIIKLAIQNLILDSPGRTEEIRKHIGIGMPSLEFIDRLSVLWGLPRSDVVRRLIDDALARDTTI